MGRPESGTRTHRDRRTEHFHRDDRAGAPAAAAEYRGGADRAPRRAGRARGGGAVATGGNIGTLCWGKRRRSGSTAAGFAAAGRGAGAVTRGAAGGGAAAFASARTVAVLKRFHRFAMMKNAMTAIGA
jgi:hypothetical protein